MRRLVTKTVNLFLEQDRMSNIVVTLFPTIPKRTVESESYWAKMNEVKSDKFSIKQEDTWILDRNSVETLKIAAYVCSVLLLNMYNTGKIW